MKVNGQTIVGEKFAYDGCHKMYVLETEQEEQEAIKFGYEIKPINLLPVTYEYSCELRFINKWDVSQPAYVEQFEKAIFEL